MTRILGCALTFAALAGFVAVAGSSAQEGKKETQRQEKKDSPNARLDVDAIVERLMAFDKNKDGKLTRDELPERLQHLIEKGDLNKDGALDRDEVRKLAQTPGLFVAEGGAGRREGGPVNLERVIDDLGVRGAKRQQARAAVQAHQQAVRKFMDKAQADLLDKMKGVLSEDEFKEFKAAVERQRLRGEGRRDENRGGEPKRDRPEKK